MPKRQIKGSIKTDLSDRLLQFRKAINKTQLELANELNIYQSTITNIERGKVQPNIGFLHYFNVKYGLDINWVLTGKGEMFLPEPIVKVGPTPGLDGDFYIERERLLRHSELLNLLEIPAIDYFISAKLTELKTILKDQLTDFYQKKKQELIQLEEQK